MEMLVLRKIKTKKQLKKSVEKRLKFDVKILFFKNIESIIDRAFSLANQGQYFQTHF
jgi:shikimate kinase